MKRALAIGGAGAIVLAAFATWTHLGLPEPTGTHGVGRLQDVWVDDSRSEVHTADTADRRQVGVVVWYPAVRDSGEPASYLPEAELAVAMVDSGELNALAAWGVQWVRGSAREGAVIDPSASSYPVVLLTPGNATNVEFYGSMAEDLASNGYVVVGVNHPYQVAATKLVDQSVALYREDLDVPAKIEERLLDLRFVVDRLEEVARERGGPLDGRLDLGSLGVMGHSNGGIAAVELCKSDRRVDACLNLDGQAAGGAFGTDLDDQAPEQPYMFLTKETELHDEIASRFEDGRQGGYRVVIPQASHDQFADGALFGLSLWPWARTADRVNEVTRGFAKSFFDLTLNGYPQEVLGQVSAPTDVVVYVYPLERT